MSFKKHLNFLELFYEKKEKNSNDFLHDEIDLDFYFFHKFLDIIFLFRQTQSIKEFTLDPHNAYQSFKLTAELHLTRKEVLFILENLKLIKKTYVYISKTLLRSPTQYPNVQKLSSKVLYSFILVRVFKSSKSCLIRIEIRFPEAWYEELVKFELSSNIYIKTIKNQLSTINNLLSTIK